MNINTIFLALAIILVAIIIAVVALFAVFMSKKNKLVNEKLASQLEHQRRVHTAELNALRGQMNPHFVHNSLNAIQYYIQRNEVEISENYLVKFSKLIRLFFDFSRKEQVTISEEIILLTHYLEIEKLRFEDKVSFEIIIDKELDPDEQMLPAMILQPIVENAINHGIFHKQGKGKVIVHFKYIDEFSFQAIVEDDGIGINQANSVKTHSANASKESHATEIITERLELLTLSKQWNVDYSIVDLAEAFPKTNKQGTSITLTLNQIFAE